MTSYARERENIVEEHGRELFLYWIGQFYFLLIHLKEITRTINIIDFMTVTCKTVLSRVDKRGVTWGPYALD